MNHLQGYDRSGDGRIKAEDLRFVLFDLGDNPYSLLCDRVIDETKRRDSRRGKVASSVPKHSSMTGMVNYMNVLPKPRPTEQKNGLAAAPGYRERRKIGDFKKRESQKKYVLVQYF